MFIKQKVYIQVMFSKQNKTKIVQKSFVYRTNKCLQNMFYKHVMFTKQNKSLQTRYVHKTKQMTLSISCSFSDYMR